MNTGFHQRWEREPANRFKTIEALALGAASVRNAVKRSVSYARKVLASRGAAVLLLICLSATGAQSASAASTPTATPTATSTAFLQSLTEQERDWLREHPVIRVFQEPGWAPIEFADASGNPTGMTRDYRAVIQILMIPDIYDEN